ncbi:MAG TPA: hypothetical protein VGU67_07620, partial [Edaphobacter sp.]|nr:hypothetical protein [Edaphobacter sp.]
MLGAPKKNALPKQRIQTADQPHVFRSVGFYFSGQADRAMGLPRSGEAGQKRAGEPVQDARTGVRHTQTRLQACH